MDYSKFKKISSDKNCTVLKHDKGHELRVAHNGLSAKERQELAKLPMRKAEGGAVESRKGVSMPDRANDAGGANSDNRSIQQQAQDNDQNVRNAEWNAINPENLAKGGRVKRFAYGSQSDGGGGDPTPAAGPSFQDRIDSFVNGSNAAANDASTQAITQQQAQETPGSLFSGKDAPVADSTPEVPPATGGAPDAPQSPDETVQANSAPVPGVAPAEPNFITERTSAPDVHQQLNNEAASLKQDFNNGIITPETYHGLFAKKDTLGKIGSIFGLLVGGAGSGLAHQPNMLMQMMDKEIDRDLDAQKNTKSNQFNALQLAEQHLRNQAEIGLQAKQGNLAQAQTSLAYANVAATKQNTAKTAMLLAAAGLTQNIANKYPPGSPAAASAQAAAQQVSNAADAHINMMNGQSAQQIEANWQAHNKAMNALSPEMAKYDSDRHIPGVGDASIALSSEDRKKVLGINNFQNLLNEAEQLNKQMGTTGRLSPAQQARAVQIKNDLVSSYNDVKGLARFTGNEEALYDKIVPDIGSITGAMTGATKAGLERLKQSVQTKKDLEYQQLGLPRSEGSSNQSQSKQQDKQPSGPAEGSTSTSGGKPIIFINGKWKFK